MSTAPVTASFVLVAIATAFGLVLMRKGQRDREWHRVCQPNTQSRRYWLVLKGQGLITTSLVWLFVTNSAGDIMKGIIECFQKGLFDKFLGLMMVLALASFFIASIAAIAILRHPSEMAHKGPVKHSYCPTLLHRTGDCEFTGVTIVFNRKTGEGVQLRTKL